MNAPKYHGIIPPLVTPLRDRNALDVAGLERLIEHILAGGVHGLFLLGTTGEGPSLSYALRKELIGRACRQVNARVPVLVGITDTAFEESLTVARWSADAGADAVVAAPPYYLPASQPELREYLSHLVAELPLPLFLYNMPSLAKVTIKPDTIRYAMAQRRIIGLKDSSGSIIYLHRIVAMLPYRPDWTVLVGPEEMLEAALIAGAHGGVNGGANVFPRLYVKLFESVRAGNLPRARELHSLVMRVSDSLYGAARNSSGIIKRIKGALSVLGICDDGMAEPFQRLCQPERAHLKQTVDELTGLLTL